ncbi:CidA/LrgA family protein [Pseudoalteromonas luteoviolacea]|uniref:CidA/LrgA family protein n=1 Tax=Pseudoalteromonas luteoviolacea TaxID=43657 RepID=UPI001B37254F|nr:CidA/LrgA family protein [Pseudoalteromonas luteoviolacea]
MKPRVKTLSVHLAKLTFGTLVVVTCLWSARMIVAFGALPIPAPLLGMLILFALLQGRIIKVDWLIPVCQPLISYLAFFFIPVGVGVINYLNLLAENALLIIILLVVLPTLALLAVGKFASKGRYRD